MEMGIPGRGATLNEQMGEAASTNSRSLTVHSEGLDTAKLRWQGQHMRSSLVNMKWHLTVASNVHAADFVVAIRGIVVKPMGIQQEDALDGGWTQSDFTVRRAKKGFGDSEL